LPTPAGPCNRKDRLCAHVAAAAHFPDAIKIAGRATSGHYSSRIRVYFGIRHHGCDRCPSWWHVLDDFTSDIAIRPSPTISSSAGIRRLIFSRCRYLDQDRALGGKMQQVRPPNHRARPIPFNAAIHCGAALSTCAAFDNCFVQRSALTTDRPPKVNAATS